MFKSFMMVKGDVAVEFKAGEGVCLIDGIRVSPETMNKAFKDLLKAGFETGVASPKKPKKTLKQYPEGFEWDAELYYEVARINRWSFCNQYGKVIVPKKYRDKIYAEMAEIQKARRTAEAVAIG